MIKQWFLSHSQIEGIGVFAKKNFVSNEPIAPVAKKRTRCFCLQNHNCQRWQITDFGKMVNHSKKYKNTKLQLLPDNQYWLIAENFIKRNSELTADYNDSKNPSFIRRVDFVINEP